MSRVSPEESSESVRVDLKDGSTHETPDSAKKPKHTKLCVIFCIILVVLVIIIFVLICALVLVIVLAIPKFPYQSECDLQRCTRNFTSPPLVIMSMDGFRAGYLNESITPAIQRLIKCGVHSKYMIPSFPSKTFPNHYAIVTGLYPAWSGIVDNHFYDAKQPSKTFSPASHQAGWYLGEPIWNTVQKFGLKSAVYFWPGSEAPINGMKPSITMPYNSQIPFTQRVDKVIEWLNLPDEERPSLIQIYVEEPDSAGHIGGPFSQIVRTAMITVDGVLNYFVNRLLDEGLMGCINFVLVSDHGMQYINASRAVIMEKILPQPFTEELFGGAIAHITMTNNDTTVDQLMAPMKCQKGQNYLTFKREVTPARYHYSGSERIGEIVMVGDPGVLIYKTEQEANARASQHGNHGFDNRIESMRAIFVAIGPSIAERREIPEFQNVQLYNLFADLLNVTAAPNNGTKGHLYSVLRNAPKTIPEIPSVLTSTKCTSATVISNCNPSCLDAKPLYESCYPSKPTIPFFITDGEECIVPLCDAVIHYNKKLQITQLVETTITSATWKQSNQNGCVRTVKDLPDQCPQTSPGGNFTSVSLFINKAEYNTVSQAFVKVKTGFANQTWTYLVNKIDALVKKYNNIVMYSGPVYDSNGDGHRDSDAMIEGNSPTHIFVVLFRCQASNEAISNQLCHDVTFIPFVLPIVEEDFNCLEPDEYLYQNTARILDIELLTGIQFFTNRKLWSPEEAILLRTRVTRNMW